MPRARRMLPRSQMTINKADGRVLDDQSCNDAALNPSVSIAQVANEENQLRDMVMGCRGSISAQQGL